MSGFPGWFDYCPFCGAKTSAATQLVLADKVRAHLVMCTAKRKKELEARQAADAQGDLFGKTSSTSDRS